MEGLILDQQPELLAQNLHEATSRLTVLLDRLAPDSSPSPVAASPQQMEELLSELMRAGEWLRFLPADRDPALECELSEYRQAVSRLRDLLPAVHAALLHERARIEQERARIAAAAEWARRSRQTL